MKKKTITTCAILTYMAIVNIFSACALYSYYKSVKTKTVFTVGTMGNVNASTHLLKQQNIYTNAMQVNEMNAHFDSGNDGDNGHRIVQLKPVSASCASRLLIYYHITEHPSHHTSLVNFPQHQKARQHRCPLFVLDFFL